MNSRMFPFITKTWNPLGGHCEHECVYCWSQGPKGLVKKYNMFKYQDVPYLVEKELERKFDPDDFIFVCDMVDLFATNVHPSIIREIFDFIRYSPAKFLLLTKRPGMYFYFLVEHIIPHNCVLGATIESNRNYPKISMAPTQNERITHMIDLAKSDGLYGNYNQFVSIEPILDFDFETFRIQLESIKPWAVAIGYDNYQNNLPEPPLAKMRQLINELKRFTIVYEKTLREGNVKNEL